MADVQVLSFTGELLRRGFWLYVWDIEAADGNHCLYVGRTGDSSSANAQSPFNRLGQHLGSNKHANALRRQLLSAGIRPEECRRFEMIAYGPIFEEAATMADHHPIRNKMAALEKQLREALHSAGYKVLNAVHCSHKLDDGLWSDVVNAFRERFPKLESIQTGVHDELQASGSQVGSGI
jgi:hypothetical protein